MFFFVIIHLMVSICKVNIQLKDVNSVFFIIDENFKSIKASPTHGTSKMEPVNGVGNATDNSISQISEKFIEKQKIIR